MKPQQALAAIATLGLLALAATAAVSPFAVAQDGTQKVVYGRSTGTHDQPEQHEIFIMDADGSDPIQLTDNTKEDAFPTLSPDGSRIAFSRMIRGAYELFVMDADGSNVSRLIETPKDSEVLPTWSPDGKKLAYTATFSTPKGPQSDIYRIRVRDGRFRRLTYTPTAQEFAPDWSPDGTEIAFSKHNQERNRFGIAAVRPDTSGLRWVVVNPKSRSGYADFNPSWSPDSQWIAFSREHGADPFVDLYKIRRDGTEVSAITELNELAENPVWGPDGRILFMHNEGIAVVGPEGGEIKYISPTHTGLPYWWPDW